MRLAFSDAASSGPCVLALGMFDGVHTGHAWLLRTAKEYARQGGLPAMVCTFSRHPMALIRPEAAPPMLSTVSERAKQIAELKMDALSVLPFTREFMTMSPEDFVKWLVRAFSPRHVVVGFNYTFGDGGAGNPALLKELGKRYGFETHVVSPVKMDGHTVSSTQVRHLLKEGKVEAAAGLLERPYAIGGRVVRGKGLGRGMGFPTANVSIPAGKALPAFGIYVGLARTRAGAYPAVINLGRHPTLPEGGITLEAHLLGVSQDLYGQKMQVDFLKRLRDEETFESVEALMKQMALDRRQAEAYFGLR